MSAVPCDAGASVVPMTSYSVDEIHSMLSGCSQVLSIPVGDVSAERILTVAEMSLTAV